MAITATGPRVPGIGPVPCDIMIVGEGPGQVEAERGIPFVGPSGEEQDSYLMRYGLHRRRIYITNLIKNWIPGNGNPTPDDIAAHEQELIDEIAQVRPRYVLAVGAFAQRWFLPDTDLETSHGLPHRSSRLPADCRVIPIHHPAYGLRDPDAKTLVWWDYKQAASIIHGEIPDTPVEDEFPDASYWEPKDADEFTDYLNAEPREVALDTECPLEYELRETWWGWSASTVPGTGMAIRRSRPDFDTFTEALREHLSAENPLVILQNGWALDMDVFRRLGIRFNRIWDTMVASFFLRVEPQALKVAARRHCGMVMTDYEDVLGDVAFEKQMLYLMEVADRAEFKKKNEPRLIYENDGTARLYTPQPVATRAAKIIADWGDDPSTNLYKRWKQVDKDLRHMVAGVLGPMPVATLDDVPVDKAVHYAGRDPDATLRLKRQLLPRIEAAGLVDRLQLDLDILPYFEEMQDTGFIGVRSKFEALSAQMWDKMMEIGSKISYRYNNGEPFNPASHPQVAALAEGRHLKGAKKTKTGKISTSKKSMEHLRRVDEAMDLIFSWREHQKVKTSFADPLLERLPDGAEHGVIRCNIKLTRVAQDRIAAADPNYTGIPVATDLGRSIRDCFVAPEGCLLASADLSQIEMRVIADLSNDPTMVRLFRDNRDIHAETAAQLFRLPMDQVDKMKHRNPTKRAGFGVATGIQGPGLLDQLRQMGCEGWTVKKYRDGSSDCVSDWCPEGVINGWFGVFPGVREFLEKCKQECARHGYVRELGGFYRYLPGIWSRDDYVRGEAGRQSHSHIISGTAQTGLRRAMQWLGPRLEELRSETGLYIRWTMQIHDELIFGFSEELEPVIKELVLEALKYHSLDLRVPVDASWAADKSWGALK